jgi:hypothetical protein
MRLAVLLLIATALAAADPTEAFQQAMAGESREAKQAALGALNGLGKDQDAAVFAALIAAIADRQVGDDAIAALRARAGVAKSGSTGPGYPGYPRSDSAADWSAWVDARNRDLEQQAKLKKIEDGLKKAGPATTAAPGPDATVEASTDEPKHAIPDDLGKLARISFKAGGNLVCYIRTRRLDADGKLVSVRIVHADGAGEETIAASLISRIDDDAR